MDTKTPSQIIDALGGTATVAKLCRVKAPSVSDWRKNGIPDARRQFLELLRPDVFGPEEGITKRALMERLALTSDTSLAVLLQLPRETVEEWADDALVPASPRLHALLADAPAAAAPQEPEDPDGGRIVPVEVA
ncbi:hypothetical protein [Stenotrophomonas acidaminiphila]|uniref:hypothetical protein n=1 Tax=Stenotrophomonas acidaminiphila TaxID=128780 RepID=UPI0028A8935D|nr:hypothetical protein [Stenotrophomonas acidaminiphila]